MDELLKEFLVEAGEYTTSLDQDLVALEKAPGNKDVINRIFRSIHTIKGTCSMFNYDRMEKVAHAAEDVLVKMRDGSIEPTKEIITPVLQAIDVIKVILDGLAKDEKEPPGDDSALVELLHKISAEAGHSKATAAPAGMPSGPAVTTGAVTAPSSEPVVDQSSLRVSVEILDSLMNLVGELVLTRNQLIQLVNTEDESRYLAPTQQLNRVTSHLQEVVMKTRMQPIGNAWSKLTRLVRDLANATGKEIDLQMTGADTEVDRQVLQAVQDPLTHCIRNSIDHGIEAQDVRVQNGKPAKGHISLNAFHEGGHIIIEVKDDGAGINAKRVREKAIEKGLLKEEAAAQFTDEQIIRFIFEPGFSTAPAVTEVSGRGVGMDVVKSNIEKIGGSVELVNRPGAGLTIRIRIPLTLAIISGLIVKAGLGEGELFAIPQVGVVELVRINESNRQFIDQIHGSKVLRLRDKLLPLIDLAQIIGLEPGAQGEDLVDANKGKDLFIVIVQFESSPFGLIVREIFDMQEIVVKPMGRYLRDINMYAGTTILGDGRVILILDTSRIAMRAKIQAVGEAEASALTKAKLAAVLQNKKTSLLLFKAGNGTPLAVPLNLVARLEEFDGKNIESADGRKVVQYREALLPLIPARESLEWGTKGDEKIPAIIFSDGRHSLGLVVTEILDIVEADLDIEAKGSQPGILGISILEDQATEIIDTYHFLKMADPQWFAQGEQTSISRPNQILFVEDSGFFRDLLKPILEAKGYEVTVAEDGQQALAILEQKTDFGLILSDIEMPNLDGLGLAKKIRANPALAKVPLLALTSMDSDQARYKIYEAGFDGHLVKFDQDVVLNAIGGALNGKKKDGVSEIKKVASL